MITKEVILSVYRQYPKRVKNIHDLDMRMLFDAVGECHSLVVDGDRLVIGSLANNPIFNCVKLEHIHAFVPFEDWVAIALSTSIIFLHKKSTQVQINLRPQSSTLWSRIKSMFKK